MIEFKIFGGILAALLIGLLFYLIPKAIYRHHKLLKRTEETDSILSEGETTGVPTSWVNIVDVLVLTVLFGLFTYTWWAQRPDGDDTPATESIIDKEVLLANFIGQLFTIAIIILIIMWRVKIPHQFGLSLKGRWKSLLWVPAILALSWGITGLLVSLGYFEFLKDFLGESPLQDSVLLLQESNDPLLIGLMAIVAGVGAPLSEEVLFRGYIYPVVKGYSAPWFGILFSGLMFGVIHYNLAGLPTLVVMGCLLALSYEKTKSLWIPIFVHLIFNFSTIAIQILSRYFPALNPEL